MQRRLLIGLFDPRREIQHHSLQKGAVCAFWLEIREDYFDRRLFFLGACRAVFEVSEVKIAAAYTFL